MRRIIGLWRWASWGGYQEHLMHRVVCHREHGLVLHDYHHLHHFLTSLFEQHLNHFKTFSEEKLQGTSSPVRYGPFKKNEYFV